MVSGIHYGILFQEHIHIVSFRCLNQSWGVCPNAVGTASQLRLVPVRVTNHGRQSSFMVCYVVLALSLYIKCGGLSFRSFPPLLSRENKNVFICSKRIVNDIKIVA